MGMAQGQNGEADPKGTGTGGSRRKRRSRRRAAPAVVEPVVEARQRLEARAALGELADAAMLRIDEGADVAMVWRETLARLGEPPRMKEIFWLYEEMRDRTFDGRVREYLHDLWDQATMRANKPFWQFDGTDIPTEDELAPQYPSGALLERRRRKGGERRVPGPPVIEGIEPQPPRPPQPDEPDEPATP